MRIFGKFNDYYDNVVGYDPRGKVWERKTRKMDVNFNQYEFKATGKFSTVLEKKLWNAYKALPRIQELINTKWSATHRNDSDYMAILGFCGKLIPVIVVPDLYGSCKSYKNYYKYLDNRKERKKNRVITEEFWSTRKPFTDRGLMEWQFIFEEIGDSIFIEFNSPMFLIKKNHYGDGPCYIEINPNLSELKLQSIIDPWTAYQEIDMYLNNQLVIVDDPDLKRSQEDIRDSKGFDNWSFKQKGPKKRKRK